MKCELVARGAMVKVFRESNLIIPEQNAKCVSVKIFCDFFILDELLKNERVSLLRDLKKYSSSR